MATSGVTTFTITRDDLIKASLRLLGVLGIGETPVTEEYTNASQTLNFLLKQLQVEGLPLWKNQNVVIPMVIAQASYTIGPSGCDVTSPKPLRILDGFIRNTVSGNDTTLQQISKQEYDQFSVKTTPGIPNSFYYQPNLTTGTVYFYNVATSTDYTVYLDTQLPVEDMVSSTDNFDFPQEWFQVIKYGLANELGPEYQININQQMLLEQKYQMYKEKAISFSQEEASVFFTATRR